MNPLVGRLKQRGGGGSLMFQAGVFPYTNKAIENFGNIYENASKNLDCLLTWITQENYLYKYNLLPHSIKRINFRVIEISFRAKNSWLSALKDRKVLIVSPFAELMEQQYKRKDDIYASTNVSLPDFDLKTVTAVNSNGYSWQTCGFNSWFEALNMLKSKIADIDFDIALLGCGAYAFPLASFCKELGKQAITTCGSTELLFGLYGTRWKNLPEINSAWIRPGEKYMPEGGKKIEDGAYW